MNDNIKTQASMQMSLNNKKKFQTMTKETEKNDNRVSIS